MTKMKSVESSNAQLDFENYYEGKASGNTCCNILQKFNHSLVKLFYFFGHFVGRYPLYFIVIPIIISIALGSGLFLMVYEENPTKLFVPSVAPFNDERKVVNKHFPMNYSHLYNPTRFTRYEGHSRLLITSKDGNSILRSILWPEILDLDERIRNISITSKSGKQLKYSDMCCKWTNRCVPNPSLNIAQIVDEIENGTTKINYPLMLVPLIVPQVLGGTVINKTALVIEDAKAIFLGYFLNIDTSTNLDEAYEWEKKLIILLKGAYERYEHIEVSFYTSRTLQDELKKKMDSSIPYIPVTGVIMVTACMGLLWTSDCLRSKPFIGLVGIISAVMSAATSFGFLNYVGATYTRLNVVAVFLVLGIGVDDIFVAISAWQKTSIDDSVPKRLAHTYADAAVSVTITSLTNALSFAVGISTPTLIITSFCMYCCVTIICAYLWFITFCGGFLALSGYLEQSKRHCILLTKIKQAPDNSSPVKKKFYSLFCSSPSYGLNCHTTKDEDKGPLMSIFFKRKLAPILMKKWFRVITVIGYILYLSGAIYGLTVLKEGMQRDRMARDDSYLRNFTKTDSKYFRHLPYSIQVMVVGDMNYSNPLIQEKLLALEKTFEESKYGAGSIYSQFWLRSFLKRLERRKDWQNEITDEDSFVKVVKEKFLANPGNSLRLDIEFNENNTRIVASRMVVQTANVTNVNEDIEMMNSFREIARNSEFNVTCFHLLFSLFDQHALLKPLAVTSIIIAIVLVIFVALIFIPDYRGSFAIASSVLSIAVGVMGYMSFWNVNLDHVSAGSLFMCIGFSVDFTAHITYTYLSSKEKSIKDKIGETLHSLGLPIIQGGLTTVLSLVSFLFIPAYGYRTFFKTIFLVTIFAASHSIILIPMLLSSTEIIFGKFKQPNFKESTSDENSTSTTNGVSGKTFRKIPTELTASKHNYPETNLELGNGVGKNHQISQNGHRQNGQNGLEIRENGRLERVVKEIPNGKAYSNGRKSSEQVAEYSLNSDENVNQKSPSLVKRSHQNGVQNEAFSHDET